VRELAKVARTIRTKRGRASSASRTWTRDSHSWIELHFVSSEVRNRNLRWNLESSWGILGKIPSQVLARDIFSSFLATEASRIDDDRAESMSASLRSRYKFILLSGAIVATRVRRNHATLSSRWKRERSRVRLIARHAHPFPSRATVVHYH